MTTVRVKKDKNYTTINNTVLNDVALSWKAKGLAAYLLSKPDDWHIRRDHLAEQSEDGISSVRSALAELEEFGYLTRSKTREESGFFAWEFTLHETPQNRIPLKKKEGDRKMKKKKPADDNRPVEPPMDNPSVDNPSVDNPSVDNRTLLSTDLPSTDLPSTDTSKPTNQPVSRSLIGAERLVGLASPPQKQVKELLPAEEPELDTPATTKPGFTETPTAQATALAPPVPAHPQAAEVERSVALLIDPDVGMFRSSAARFAEQHSFVWLVAQVADWWEDSRDGKATSVGALYNRISKAWDIIGVSDAFLRSELYKRHYAQAPPGDLLEPIEAYTYAAVIQ